MKLSLAAVNATFEGAVSRAGLGRAHGHSGPSSWLCATCIVVTRGRPINSCVEKALAEQLVVVRCTQQPDTELAAVDSTSCETIATAIYVVLVSVVGDT